MMLDLFISLIPSPKTVAAFFAGAFFVSMFLGLTLVALGAGSRNR